MFFFFFFPLKGQPGAGRTGEGREGHYVQNTRNTKGDRSTHILEGWGAGQGGIGMVVLGRVCWRRGHPASVTAQAVVLRKIRTSSLY